MNKLNTTILEDNHRSVIFFAYRIPVRPVMQDTETEQAAVTTDDVSEFDQLWDEDESSDTGDEPAADEPTPDTESQPETEPESASTAGDTDDDPEVLRHKLSSAEGRMKVFQGSLDDMKNKLASLEASQVSEPEPEEEPEPVAPALPDGWTQEDWDDYRSDNPVGAELFENQNRDVEQLKEQVNQTTQQQQMEQAQREFNSTVMAQHPDYLELLGNKREDIRTFIESESNPLLRQAYQGVYQQGSAEQVAELMTAYKASRQETQENLQQRRVQDALAVPSRSPSPNAGRGKSGVPDENDFDAAWDYFSDDAFD